jgi:hypothetical protein
MNLPLADLGEALRIRMPAMAAPPTGAPHTAAAPEPKATDDPAKDPAKAPRLPPRRWWTPCSGGAR